MLGFIGLAYSLYPYVVIDQLTVWQAASSTPSLIVHPASASAICVPAIVVYTIFSYRVFGGKARELKYA